MLDTNTNSVLFALNLIWVILNLTACFVAICVKIQTHIHLLARRKEYHYPLMGGQIKNTINASDYEWIIKWDEITYFQILFGLIFPLTVIGYYCGFALYKMAHLSPKIYKWLNQPVRKKVK